MNTINKILNWFLLSSKDPKEASLTFKGILLGTAPILIGIFHGDANALTFVNQLTMIFQGLLIVISTLITVYGATRKILLTISR